MPQTLECLVSDLREAFDEDPDGGRAAALLRAYAAQGDDWRRFAFFEPDAYTRNLIESNDCFELLLLCWSEGQSSPVHNHEGQNCWMAVLEGEMEEERFALPASRGPLLPTQRFGLPQGNVAFIRDEIGLHVVRPREARRGVSLHLYAAPIPECNCYCERTGAVTRRRLDFYSVRGRRQALLEG